MFSSAQLHRFIACIGELCGAHIAQGCTIHHTIATLHRYKHRLLAGESLHTSTLTLPPVPPSFHDWTTHPPKKNKQTGVNRGWLSKGESNMVEKARTWKGPYFGKWGMVGRSWSSFPNKGCWNYSSTVAGSKTKRKLKHGCWDAPELVYKRFERKVKVILIFSLKHSASWHIETKILPRRGRTLMLESFRHQKLSTRIVCPFWRV